MTEASSIETTLRDDVALAALFESHGEGLLPLAEATDPLLPEDLLPYRAYLHGRMASLFSAEIFTGSIHQEDLSGGRLQRLVDALAAETRSKVRGYQRLAELSIGDDTSH